MTEAMIVAVYPKHNFKRIFEKTYTSPYLNETLEDRLKKALKRYSDEYPAAYIVAVDNETKELIKCELENQVVEPPFTVKEVFEWHEAESNNPDKYKDRTSYGDYVEDNPYVVTLETDNIYVESRSYHFSSESVKEHALRLSKENPKHRVKVMISVRFRYVLLNGEVLTNNQQVPYLNDGTTEFEFFKKQWNSVSI